jgi:hypothetical protein
MSKGSGLKNSNVSIIWKRECKYQKASGGNMKGVTTE